MWGPVKPVDLRCTVLTMAGDHTEAHTRTVAAVLGTNVRRLRGEHTLADLARYAQGWGLNWTTGTVANVESGRSSPTVTTIYLLTLALGDLLDRPDLAPTELLQGEGPVAVPGGEVDLALLRSVLSDKRVRRPKPDKSAQVEFIERVWATWPERLQKLGGSGIHETKGLMTEADVRIGKSLGLDPDRTAAEMYFLWKRPLTVERNARAGAGANAQARGQISRTLKADLRRAVTDGDS